MIAERNTGRTVQSTLRGEEIAMGIDPNAMAHIMNVLTDLYSDQELAIIREYSTNALDAHIEAGVTRPIEVQTPSQFSPFLRIKDHGVGLDANDIRTIYSQYGNSTKRSTNDQVGMLGLGCKSALTYTDNFVVVSVKDGERVEVSIERNEDGAGVMKMPTVAETNAPNGTEVIIPAKAGNRITQKAAHFFSFWKEGTVLVNGTDPQRIEGIDLNGDGKILVINGDTSYIVMGNVPYPVQEPLSLDHGMPRGYRYETKSICAFVGIGEVNFPPSRETLMNTATTKATIKRLEGEIKAGLAKVVQREVAQAATARDAIQAYLKWANILGSGAVAGDYRFKGMPLPRALTPQRRFPISAKNSWSPGDTLMLVTENSNYKLGSADPENSYPVARWNGTLFIHGWDQMTVTPTTKRKMIQYVTGKGIATDIRRFVLLLDKPTQADAAFIGQQFIADWADIKALKLPTQGGAAKTVYGRLPGSYDLYDETGYRAGVSGDDIDQSKPIFWVHGRTGNAARYAQMLKQYHPNGFYVVALSQNRIDKFKRIIPSAKTASQGVVDLWKKESAKFTAKQLRALHVHDQGEASNLEGLDEKKILDPDLVAAIRLVKETDITDVVSKRTEFSRIVDTDTLNPVTWSNPLDKYPLFDAVKQGSRWISGSRDRLLYGEHMYLYINAAYQAA